MSHLNMFTQDEFEEQLSRVERIEFNRLDQLLIVRLVICLFL